jgi:hypothetical protein
MGPREALRDLPLVGDALFLPGILELHQCVLLVLLLGFLGLPEVVFQYLCKVQNTLS